ncbi:MAG: purine-binding chemotaxis protein CheW [Anaerolineaceae bacterium]|nr:purine-binding chemotaxis protein CheW [Anaerolineaceae bacterium]
MDSYLTFRLGGQIYGLPLETIQQIIPMQTITPLPDVPEQVAGAISVHGQAVPVVDMRRHIGLAAAPYLLYTPIILACIGGSLVGLVVDEVLDVLDFPAGDLQPAGELLPAELGQSPVLRSLAQVAGRLAVLIEPEELFDPEQRQALALAAELLPGLTMAGHEPAGDALS